MPTIPNEQRENAMMETFQIVNQNANSAKLQYLTQNKPVCFFVFFWECFWRLAPISNKSFAENQAGFRKPYGLKVKVPCWSGHSNVVFFQTLNGFLLPTFYLWRGRAGGSPQFSQNDFIISPGWTLKVWTLNSEGDKNVQSLGYYRQNYSNTILIWQNQNWAWHEGQLGLFLWMSLQLNLLNVHGHSSKGMD